MSKKSHLWLISWAIAVALGTSDLSLADEPQAPGATGAPKVPATPNGSASDNSSGHPTPGVGNAPAVSPTSGVSEAGVPQQERFDQQLLNWFGVRPYLADKGLTFNPTLTLDYSKNPRGGLDTRTDAFRNLFDARINFDTEPLLGLKGGTFSLDFQNQNGRQGSSLLTGDTQGFSNIDADGRTQISELWYEQKFLDDKLRLKIGKVDANTEFAAPEYATEFINGSFGYSPTITGMPTYPDPALSINVFVYPTTWFYAGYGIYDGGDGKTTGDHPPTTAFRSPTDYFQIAEAGFRWTLADQTLPGRLAGGVFYNNGSFEKFDGSHQSGTSGFYILAEQKLLHYNFDTKDDQRGIYAFAQYGWGDEEVNDFHQHVGAGLSWIGPYQSENLDSLGIGFTTVFFSDAAGSPFTRDSETSIEAFYNFQATSYLSIKPDLQYIVNPGGDETLHDALVATLRVTIAF